MARINHGALAVALTLAVAVPTACGDGGNGGGQDWVVVTDVAGLGDEGFNDLAYAGVQQAADELGGEAGVLESTEPAEYVPNLQQAVDGGASLVVAVGFALTDAVVEVASDNPEARFLLIDSVAAGQDGEPLQNVRSVTFREQEPAYLAGVVAGMTTEADRVGFVGGQQIPPVERFLAGFRAGLDATNPDASLAEVYIGSFADTARGRELARNHYDSGADVLFEVAGLGGLGTYEAARAEGPGHWVIGVDTCKDEVAPDNFLTAATKDVTGQVLAAARQLDDGSFEGGAVSVGLAEGAAGLCEDTFDDLPPDVRTAVQEAENAIVDGELTVPEG